MRSNKYVAQATGLSRRAADAAIAEQRVTVNGSLAVQGSDIADNDVVQLDGQPIALASSVRTIMLNKPVGYVVSRNGQGSRTVYDLLPPDLHALKPVGRLDKDSSGLMILTSDGDLANRLTHPSQQKRKVYQVQLDKDLQPLHRQMIADHGIQLADGRSQMELARQNEGNDTGWIVTMREGRNRQIRRTFNALGYNIVKLHRTQFGDYQLGQLRSGSHAEL